MTWFLRNWIENARDLESSDLAVDDYCNACGRDDVALVRKRDGRGACELCVLGDILATQEEDALHEVIKPAWYNRHLESTTPVSVTGWTVPQSKIKLPNGHPKKYSEASAHTPWYTRRSPWDARR